MYFKASFGEDSLTLFTAAKLCFSIFIIILFEKPRGASLLCQNQRQLEVNVCRTTVVVIPIGYSYISLYSYISKIPPVFGQEVGSLLPTLHKAGLQRREQRGNKQRRHRQASLPFVMKTCVQPDSSHCWENRESEPLRAHVDKLTLPQISCGTGEKKENCILLLLLQHLLLEIITRLSEGVGRRNQLDFFFFR